MTKNKPTYSPGDLVQLARFGYIPDREEDRVYGTVLESLDVSTSGYHVPRYRIRLIGSKKNAAAPFGSRFENDDRIAIVLEYDITTAKQGSQD